MARADRLSRLLQALRTLPTPVTAARLAAETGVSVRSLYRDVESLRAAGPLIEGERGYRYRLVEDGALPPQVFDRPEVEALVLGLAEVRHMGDSALAEAAAPALARIAATLPDAVQRQVLHAASRAYRFEKPAPAPVDVGVIRRGCWREEAAALRYTDRDGRASERIVWPLSIVSHEQSLTLLAWCRLRGHSRMFRVSRMTEVRAASENFRPRRAELLRVYLERIAARDAAR